jgi:5-methylcytosine-specific restriction protein A
MPTAPRKHQPPRYAREARPGPSVRGYDRSWRRLRAAFLMQYPMCEDCMRKPATEVDHIIAIEKGGNNDDTNLQALCKSCHSRKTVKCDGGFGHTRRPNHPREG